MSQANPTALRIGMTGMLDGRRFTVRGRVVLSVKVEGETYYWNEFNLVDSSGNGIILVFEEVDEGSPWKIFQLFEPLRPMIISDAAARKIGDVVDFDGRRARISLVDQSRVVYVEGRAPEGVETGDIANYFNAEVGDRMIVVSWSGQEVEFYEGGATSSRRIEAAFSLPHDAAHSDSQFRSSGEREGLPAYLTTAVVVAMLAVVGVIVYGLTRDDTSPLPAPKRAASEFRWPTGMGGLLAGQNFRITAHALVEVARLGDKFNGHEYSLTSTTGERALLIKSLQGKDQSEWYLLKPVNGPANFTPYDAAALRQGKLAVIKGQQRPVGQLFQIRVLARDGDESPSTWFSDLEYGFLAGPKEDWLIARWSETGIQFYEAKVVSDRDAQIAFGSGKRADK